MFYLESQSQLWHGIHCFLVLKALHFLDVLTRLPGGGSLEVQTPANNREICWEQLGLPSCTHLAARRQLLQEETEGVGRCVVY